MLSYILRRVLYAVPILLGVLVITFLLFRGLQKPDTIAKLALGQKAPTHALTAFKVKHHLDRPLPEQFRIYLKGVATLDFGESWKTGRSIAETFVTSLAPTLLITIPGFLCGILAALGLALYQVFVRYSRVDRAMTLFCVALMSVPTIVYIIVSQAILALQFNYFPAFGFEFRGLETAKFLILPVSILAIVNLGYDGRMFRAVFLEEIAQDYVRTASAKGVGNMQVLTRHVLKNGLIAIITLTVGQLPALIMGSLLIESFFGIPGLGNQLFLAIQQGDQPVVMACVFLGAVLYLMALTLTDVLYAFADPRIRLS
jgi:peptide/nickel transport system permease protein